MTSKCKCGGNIKLTFHSMQYMPGYKCIAFCDKSKFEVVGGGVFHTKREAKQIALEKLLKAEKDSLDKI